MSEMIEVNRLCAKCRHPRWCHSEPKDVGEGEAVCDYNEGDCFDCYGFVEGLDEFICDWTNETEEIGCARQARIGVFCLEHGVH